MPFLPWGAVEVSPWPGFWTFVLPTWLGGLAVFLLLPRPRRYPAWAGVTCGLAALLLAGFFVVRPGSVTLQVLPETILFYAFSALAIVFGTLLVTQSHPARAALSFTVVVLSTCGLFLLLAAPFLMVATIIIYAGAIIVTFLFVLMLAQQSGYSDADARSREPLLASVTGFVLLGVLLYVLRVSYGTGDLDRQLAQAKHELADLQQRTEKALAQDTTDKMQQVVGTPGQQGELFASYRAFFETQDLTSLKDQVADLELDWDAHPSREVLERLRDTGAKGLSEEESRYRELYNRRSWTQPPGNRPLSDQSGPPSNVGPEQLRRSENGMPQLPHDNSAYLGRSLFTDYLLPVELGGTLLMVAAVGAIAIAHRKVESRAQSAPQDAALRSNG